MKVVDFPGTYFDFLAAFVKAGYNIRNFIFEPSDTHDLILRHDVDDDPEIAYQMAKYEAMREGRASYFFMERYPGHDLPRLEIIKKEIGLLGHNIYYHYSPTPVKYVLADINAKTGGGFYSIHKPGSLPLEYFDPNVGTRLLPENAYSPIYYSKIKYISDSRGEFREGNPFESDWFKAGKSCQVLIHPIWWKDKLC
jgi:hypothetical protein